MKPHFIVIIALVGVTLLFIAYGSGWGSSGTLAFQSGCFPTSTAQSKSVCDWKFLEYQPSAWEQEWVTNLEERKFQVCELIYKGKDLKHSIDWVTRNIELMKNNYGTSFIWQPNSDSLYSKMRYQFRCSGDVQDEAIAALSGTKMEMLIEPLVGNTRDPFTMCETMPEGIPEALANRQGWDSIQSKRHLLMGPYSPMRFQTTSLSEWSPWTLDRSHLLPDPATLAVMQGRRIILFDLGAALYGSWKDLGEAASTKYFVENFQMRRGIKFTHIYAFEYTINLPTEIWSQVPEDILPFYHYINVGVESTPNGRFNPLSVLKKIATPHDFVVIKLDIDSPHIENPLVEQLLNTPQLLALVDEMTYEHHVYAPEMVSSWGDLPRDVTLMQTYSYFTRLRQAGVRMHSWP